MSKVTQWLPHDFTTNMYKLNGTFSCLQLFIWPHLDGNFAHSVRNGIRNFRFWEIGLLSDAVHFRPVSMCSAHNILSPTKTDNLHIIIIIIISFMELGHLLTRSGLTYPEVSSKVYHDSFCQLGSNVSLPWVIYFEAFYLHVVEFFSMFRKYAEKLQISFKKNLTRITDILHEYQYTFMVISRWIILRIFHTKAVEKTKTHILCSINVFQKKRRLWDNVDKYVRDGEGTDDNVIWRKGIASRIRLQTHTQNI